MRTLKTLPFVIAAFLVLGYGIADAEEVVVYSGSELSSQSEKTLIDVPTGDTVLLERIDMTLTAEGSPAGSLSGSCIGLGLRKTTGEHSVDFYCLYNESEKDSLLVKGVGGDSGGILQVLEGAGKWKGAKGKGTFSVEKSGIAEIVSEYRLEIVTP